MKYKNKRYLTGLLMISLQYLIFYKMSNIFEMKVNMRNLSFFIFIFIYLKEDIYSFKTYLIWEELKKQLKCGVEYTVVISIIIYYILGASLLWKYNLMGVIALLYSLLVMKLIRRVLYKFMKSNLIIIGVGQSAKELTDIIKKNRFTMYNLVGYMHVDKVFNQEKIVDKEKILGSYDELEKIKLNERVEEVIVALPSLSDKEMNEIVDKIEKNIDRIKFTPKINKMYTFNPQIQDYDGVMLISAKNYMSSRKRKIMKRILDICGALVGMLLLAPLYLICGVKIKKDGGPILFVHTRIGRGLKPFKMYKFRSMYIDAEERLEKMFAIDAKVRKEFYTNFKLKTDPRITKIGEFLRKTSLDEFPQFINVLKGNMSLVGPRPVIQKEVDMYYGTEMGKKVFQAKPGITGMWQAHGRSDIEDYEERIALDLYYIRNWSLWLDIIILIKTIKNVIGRKGAY